MIRALLLLIFAFFVPSLALADTPLTSAELHLGYDNVPQVQAAKDGGMMTPELVAWLSSDAPIDHKAAAISALGWRSPGVTHGRRFLTYLAASQAMTESLLTIDRMRAADLFVFGYLIAMDDPHELRPLDPASPGVMSLPAWEILSIAATALPDDFTVQLVRALVEGQRDASSAWCSVYLEGQLVFDRFEEGKRNLSPAAQKQVWAAFASYQESCGTPKSAMKSRPSPTNAAPKDGLSLPLKPELNQIYSVATTPGHVITATQGGVVVWERRTGRTIAFEPEPICVDVVVDGNAAWIGCQRAVIRYDGVSFKRYLRDQTSTDAFKVRPGPGGAIVVAHGGKLFEYSAEFDAFRSAPLSYGGGEGYDLLWSDGGQSWRISFMKSVVRAGESLPVKSSTYGGSDPRSLYADPGGGVWVIDFNDGFYRYVESTGVFQRVPGIASRGSDVVVDAARQRVWLLHYTDGVYLKDGTGPSRFFDLSQMLYLRDLHVDSDGDLWVAGWNQLVRLREEGGKWTMAFWKVPVAN